jgi:hypothetical protein
MVKIRNLIQYIYNSVEQLFRYVSKHSLPSDRVMVRSHVEKLITIQEAGDVVLSTKLTRQLLSPKNWESMRVSDALSLFDMKVSNFYFIINDFC